MSATEDHAKRLWIKYKNQYNYVFDKEDDIIFFQTFSDNYEFIIKHNSENHKFKCEINGSAHITQSEFEKILIREAFDPIVHSKSDKIIKKKKKLLKFKKVKDLDWRIKNIVPDIESNPIFYKDKYSWITPIFNCIESMYKLKKDEEIILSKKQLLKNFNEIASVGIVGLSQWVLLQAQNTGFCEEYDYREFDDLEATKEFNENTTFYKIEGFRLIKQSKNTVKNALETYGPLLIHLNASEKPFRFYKSGIYHSTSLKNKYVVNHSALLVGFDKKTKKGSWIIQNSWGTDWGNNGYINIDIEDVTCDVTSQCFAVY